MALYFEVKATYDKTQENGSIAKVTEPFLFDALSFTEAESRAIEELTPFISGDFTVKACKRTKIAEIFSQKVGDKWWLVKANFITLDERTAKEKKSMTQFLVSADTFKEAYDNFMEGMSGTMADFEVHTIAETPIMDVYPAKLS